MRLISMALLFGTTLLTAPVAWGHPHHEVDHSGHTSVDKLLRGLAGMVAGVLELPGNIVAVNREDGGGAAATIGFAKGLGMIPVRELVGVYEFITSPIPFPEGYRSILSPEYPWEYFNGAHSASFSAGR